MEITKGIDFDDVMLVPKATDFISSRDSVSVRSHIGKIDLDLPVIASPMKGIVGLDIIMGIYDAGGIGILHRFFNENEQEARLNKIQNLWEWGGNFGVAVGIGDDFYTHALHYGASIICVDVANGYLPSVRRTVEEISNYILHKNYTCEVMAGNVATIDGAQDLYNAGASIIRVGIGSGQLCTTRNNTGVGVPQITAIQNCSTPDWYTVADGGIKNSGDAVKALASGADAVMIGTAFANCLESEHDGEISGMASRDFQEQFYGEVKKSVEGISKKVEKTVPLHKFLDEFKWNMKSALTYLNCANLYELRASATFITTGRGSIKDI